MNIKKVEKFLKEHNQPKFRLKQIVKAVYQDGVSLFSEITTLPKSLGHQMSKLSILSFEIEKVLEAKDGRSVKAALRLSDGNIVETVLLSPLPDVWSICISTQAGCPMGCAFCATGKGGFKRNLTAEEITDQILFWKQYLKKKLEFKNSNLKLTNVVYMGMGEPFLNWENVKESLEDLISPEKLGFGSRSISVSTSGIPDGMINFAQAFPQMNLALSLHFADDKKRSGFMPVNKKYDLEGLKKALREYFKITNRKVFIEYIMLDGINDSMEDAENLAAYLKEVGDTKLLHVNLIGYNATDTNLKSSSANKTHAFKNYLLRNKINVTVRKSLGKEIQGACGQLAPVK